MLINNEFNKIQINENIEKDANGKVFKRSLMINIRSNEVDEAEQLYSALKAKLNNDPNSQSKDNNVPTCECGSPMVLRNGSRGAFYGCSAFPQCRLTKELNEASETEVNLEEMPRS